MGGLLIALLGSLAKPDTSFKWWELNERIPLIDDIEPPKDDDESDERLQRQAPAKLQRTPPGRPH